MTENVSTTIAVSIDMNVRACARNSIHSTPIQRRTIIRIMRTVWNPMSLFVGLAMLVTACGATVPAALEGPGVSSSPQSALSMYRADTTHFAEVDKDHSSALERLWRERVVEEAKSGSGFTLGAGDVLRISVPQIPQLKERTERVSEESTIALPLLGLIDVRGMTQKDLLNDLTHRVRKYMYHPQVAVFLLHSESREVAVLGAVKTPGRYMMTSRSDSIMTMISRSGGMTGEAASRIIFVPGSVTQERAPTSDTSSSFAPPGVDVSGARGSSVSQVALRDSTDPDTVTNQTRLDQVVISTSSAKDERYLELPVEPGDVIIVPAAGQVTVQGWVDKPGAFSVTPGMTVLGSIAAAGGPLFSSSATLLREQGDERKLELPLDLGKVRRGEEPDVPVQGGDVVVVERSVAGAVPYSLYFLVQRIGVGLPVIP
jgi:polysaccharide biosynthesis/export protein